MPAQMTPQQQQEVVLCLGPGKDVTDLSSLFDMSEYLYVLVLVWLVIYGAGMISIDYLIRRRFMHVRSELP